MSVNTKTKEVEIGGKTYILTGSRDILRKILNVSPDLFKIAKDVHNNGNVENLDLEFEAGMSLYDHIDVIFYAMIKPEHKEITKEQSDELYKKFSDEYNDVDEHLLNFLYESFTGGIPREKKKNLNW